MSIKEHPPQAEASSDKSHESQLHVPVLLEQALHAMKPELHESYLDLTAGYGGHAEAFLKVTNSPTKTVLVDRDEHAIKELVSFEAQGVRLLHQDFVSAARQLIEEGKRFDLVFVDLGVSSPQLDRAERGFSFRHKGPLDMRMDSSSGESAAELINRLSEEELYRLLVEYGEEVRGFARRISRRMVQNRPFTTTKELADLILDEHIGKWQRIHPATRTFQALRIAVNNELTQISEMLPLLPALLQPGGRVGVISFHSLEDRLVKRYFKEQFEAGLEAELKPLTKKPLDGATYDVHNPRSRSAKLRVAVKK